MKEQNVTLKIEGLDFRQDCGPLIKAFFPGLVSDSPVSILIDAGDKHFHIEACKTASDSQQSESGDNGQLFMYDEDVALDEPDAKLFHREYRNLLLKGLYSVLSRMTNTELPWGVLTGVRPTKLIFDRIDRAEAGHLEFMREQYRCSPKKAALATRVAALEYRLLREIDYKNGYSLYIGIPFCPSICNYCSFGSHPIGKFENLVEPYIDALIKEIEFSVCMFPDKKLETIYFGGGTPTAVSAEQLRRVIRCVKSCFDMTHVAEFTVEAGRPDSITREKLEMLKEEGITRISINPQSMVERTLETIGRKHTPEQICEAFALARELGFDNINMDLIAGLTGEDEKDFAYTLKQIEKLDPDSITVHTLAKKRAARLTTESELYEGMESQNVSSMLELSRAYMEEHGYEPYYLYRQKNMIDNLENVGYAKPGHEGLYNILIMEEVQTIVACGAGASSKINFTDEHGISKLIRGENVRDVRNYIERIDEMLERKRELLLGHGN